MHNPEEMAQLNNPEAMVPHEKRRRAIIFRTGTVESELHPDRNEDALFTLKDQEAFGVFDGMGGQAAGDVASREAKDYIADALKRAPQELTLKQTQQELKNVLLEANNKIVNLSKESPQLKGMGTTASVVKIWEGRQGERKAVIANAGDSRVYVMREDGKLEQITTDDNNINNEIKDKQKALDMQKLLNNNVNPSVLNPEQRRMLEGQNIIFQSLGRPNIEPHVYTVDIHDNDKMIVTSDGVHDNLTDIEIADILTDHKDPQDAVYHLVVDARDRSRQDHPRAKKDDISAIVTEFPPAKVAPEKKDAPLSVTRRIENKQRTIEQSQPKELRVGDLVYVQRSSGKIEPDWKLIEFDKKSGDAIVSKEIHGENMVKQIPQAELENLNRALEKDTIFGALNFTELYRALDQKGGLPGTKQYFKADQLKKTIDRVRKGKKPLASITRTDGLRDRVKDLLQAEKLRGEIDLMTSSNEEVIKNLEQLSVPFGGMERIYSGGSTEEVLRYGKFVDGVEALVKYGINKKEAKKILDLIESYPPGRRHKGEDTLRLNPLIKKIKRLAR